VALLAEQPVTLRVVVDDAELAGQESASLLEALVRERRAAGIVLVDEASHGGATVWRDLPRVAERFELPALDLDEQREVMRMNLPAATRVSGVAEERILSESGGRPARIVEICSLIRRRGVLRPTGAAGFVVDESALAVLPLSNARTQSVASKLSLLNESLQTVVRCLAVLGNTTETELSAVLQGIGAGEIDVGRALSRLEKMGWIGAAEGSHFAWTDDRQRDGVLGSVDARKRTKIESASYAIRRQRGGDDAVLASHARWLGLREEAGHKFLLAADARREALDWPAAEGLYTLALESLATGTSARCEALGWRGVSRWHLTRMDEALGDLEDAEKMALDLRLESLACRWMLEAATAHDWRMDLLASQKKVMEVALLVREPIEPSLATELAIARARCAMRSMHTQIALSLLGALPEEMSAENRTVALLIAGVCWEIEMHAEKALEPMLAAARLASDRRDWLHLAAAQSSLPVLYREVGSLSMVLVAGREAVEAARKSGNLMMECMARYNLGEAMLGIGEAEAAQLEVQLALDVENASLRFRMPGLRLLGFLVAFALRDARRAAELAVGATQLEESALPIQVWQRDTIVAVAARSAEETWRDLRERRDVARPSAAEWAEFERLYALRHDPDTIAFLRAALYGEGVNV
jgi:hypothetical protein